MDEVAFFNGYLRLAGTLYSPPTSDPSPAMIVLHAAQGGLRSFPFYQHLTRVLPGQGIAVLLYDRRGSGESEGDFNTASFQDLASDGMAAYDYLRNRADIDPGRIGLYGISQGGWIAPLVAAMRSETALQVLVSSCGVSPAEQMDFGAANHLRQDGFPDDQIQKALDLRRRINEYYRGRLAHSDLMETLRRNTHETWYTAAFIDPPEAIPEDVSRDKWYLEMDYDPLPVWDELRCPSLFIFSDNDKWVPVVHSIRKLRPATGHLPEAEFIKLSGLDHMMTEADGHVSERYLKVMLNWLAKTEV